MCVSVNVSVCVCERERPDLGEALVHLDELLAREDHGGVRVGVQGVCVSERERQTACV